MALLQDKMCTNFPKMHKKYILIILLLASLIVNAGDKSASVGINGGLKLKTVVIDAGHGGKEDPIMIDFDNVR